MFVTKETNAFIMKWPGLIAKNRKNVLLQSKKFGRIDFNTHFELDKNRTHNLFLVNIWLMNSRYSRMVKDFVMTVHNPEYSRVTQGSRYRYRLYYTYSCRIDTNNQASNWCTLSDNKLRLNGQLLLKFTSFLWKKIIIFLF